MELQEHCMHKRQTNLCLTTFSDMDFLNGVLVRNLPINAGAAKDTSLITGLGRSPGEGNGAQYSILARTTSWTEEPGRL